MFIKDGRGSRIPHRLSTPNAYDWPEGFTNVVVHHRNKQNRLDQPCLTLLRSSRSTHLHPSPRQGRSLSIVEATLRKSTVGRGMDLRFLARTHTAALVRPHRSSPVRREACYPRASEERTGEHGGRRGPSVLSQVGSR